MNLSSTQAAQTAEDIVRSYVADCKIHARDCLSVRDHNTAKILPFIYRPGQKVMHDIAEKRKAEHGYLKILLLKNRRFGGSTYIGGRGYTRASLTANQSIFIMGHESKSTKTLYKMVQLFHELNPIAPPTRKSNADELIFDDERKGHYGLKSEYQLDTAKNVEAGRAQGIHFLHLSEESMYPAHAEDLLTSLFSCVPRPPADTEIWRESTGKGYGNTFQVDVFETWADGKHPYFTAKIKDYAPHMPDADIDFTFAYENLDPVKRSDWVLIFVPWFIDPSCQTPFKFSEEKTEFLKRLEVAKDKKDDINYEALGLQKKYKLTLEQLYWREWAIPNECKGSVEIFKQENPANIFEAFRTKGTNHFTAEFCNKIEQDCQEPLVIGNVIRRMGMGAPRVDPSPTGRFSMWERHDKREQYFLTVDAAGGKREIHFQEQKNPDKTVIDVWNLRDGNQVAQWHGHMDYDVIHEMVEAIGEMYGPGSSARDRAVACVELNNHGFAVVAGLKKSKYPMYSYKPGEYGFNVARGQRQVLADGLLDGARNGVVTIRCLETVGEMRTFVEVNAKYGAEAGCKDDRVDSAAMAVQMMEGKIRARRNSGEGERDGEGQFGQSEAGWMVS